MIVYNRIKEIPIIVRVLTFTYNGYIVGGAAKYLIGKADTVKDWDVVIPPEHWSEVCKIADSNTKINTWGGFKYDNIDFWPEDLGHYFRTQTKNLDDSYAIHPRSMTVIERKEKLI